MKRKMETKWKSKDEKHRNPARDQTARKKETKPWFPSNPNSDQSKNPPVPVIS
jgi:hypothetical protein